MNKSFRRTMLVYIAIFILLPLLIGILMYARMQTVLHNYTLYQVENRAETLTDLASRRLASRMEELERVAGYFRDGIVQEETMPTSAKRLLSMSDQLDLGIVRLGGEPLGGKALPPAEYPAVQNAFRGRSTVRYRKGEGMIFTAPIYNGDNIKYVLYEFFDEDDLFRDFGDGSFDGNAAFLMLDNTQGLLIPLSGAESLQQEGLRTSLDVLRSMMLRDGTAARTVNGTEETQILFITELTQPNLFLVGVTPYKAAAGTLYTFTNTVLMVFLLLFILLAIGTVCTVRADSKARESDELRAAKQSAETAYQSKSRFLANMSHELRTPINAIMGMNEMILRESREPDTRERAMDVKSASQILLSLINDVLDFSKIESGMLTIIPAEYRLTTLIRDLTLLSENRARAKSLNFELDIAPELPDGLLGDDLRLQQILTNLLTNAIKYTHEGNVVLQIGGRRLSEDTVLLHCAVVDTGSGIKPEDIDKLMQLTPYTRVDEDRNRKVEGSGLGLPIIINLLKLMGSELKVESVYGKGSTFWFDLEQRILEDTPIGNIREKLENSIGEYEYRVICYAPQARVLVVDDNSLNRKIFNSLMMPTAIQVTAVSSGKRCLEICQKEHFDLIFMDHLMPEMDGVETMHRLEELPGNLCKDTPVIALTANAFSGAQEAYEAMGFDAFLAKPIVSEKLEAMLLAMLPPEKLEKPPECIPPAVKKTPAELPQIEGVNWDFALLHISDTSLLQDALEDFFRNIDGERAAISMLAEQAGDEEGLSAYRTRVHALKSTAATVGLLTVSELARILEDAAKNGDRDRIAALTPVLLELLEKTKARIAPFMEAPEEKTPMTDRAQLTALLETLRAAVYSMDIAASDEVMRQLDRYSYEPETQESIDKLKALTANLDFDGALGLLDGLCGGTASEAPPDGEAPEDGDIIL